MFVISAGYRDTLFEIKRILHRFSFCDCGTKHILFMGDYFMNIESEMSLALQH